MDLYPAIDLKDGNCVRLRQGRADDLSLFNTDPLQQASIFRQQGFCHLHLVDLDGAFSGESKNSSVIRDIITASKDIFVQLGGGIRTLKNIDDWLDYGVNRIILGTIAVTDKELVKKAARLYPQRIAIGLDASDGRLQTCGWRQSSNMSALEIAKEYRDCGIDAIIYTDIKKDGMMQGLNLDQTAELARNTDIPVIASGGVKNIDDIESLVQLNEKNKKNISGVIIGKALYEKNSVTGGFDIKRALRIAAQTAIQKAIQPAINGKNKTKLQRQS